MRTQCAAICILMLCCLVFTGCGSKQSQLVNTSTLPGQMSSKLNPKNPKIVYLGEKIPTSPNAFGPSDVTFDFQNLK